jgi:hypothetical protein
MTNVAVDQTGRRVVRLKLALWCYLILGLLWLFVGTWPFVLLVLRTIHQFEFLSLGTWFVGWGWAGLTTFSLIWGVLNWYWGRNSLQNLQVVAGYTHLALAICCGLGTVGLHWVSVGRSFNESPIIIDPEQRLPEQSTVEDLSGPILGSVNRGKAWFSLSCVTCHGPTGEGLNNLAPSLKESEFLKVAQPVEINLLIRGGRPITDPANLSGKPMPARGGDRSLTSEKIADLVAFVMSLQNRTADGASLSWEGVTAPDPELSKATFRVRPQNRQARSVMRNLLLVHGLLMSMVCLAGAWCFTGWLRGKPARRLLNWWAVTGWGWLAALCTWLMLLVFFAW